MFKGIKYILLSLITVFKHILKRPVTLEYPEKKCPQPEEFRGKPVVHNCISCKTCTKVCPSGAITITENEFIIDLNKCILCGNCEYYCPLKAIVMSSEYELATNNKDKLKLIYKLKEDKE